LGIIIFGASGAGSTTLGKELDEQWITEMPCLAIRVDGTKNISENVNWILEQLKGAV